MRKQISLNLLLALLIFGVLGCAELTPAQKVEQYGPNPPRIIDAYAQNKMIFSDTWQIFLDVEDPDGDMLDIEAHIRVAGGNFDFATVHLKPEMGGRFKGYVWLDLPFRGHVGYQIITLTLWVVDRAEHKSPFMRFNLYTGDQMSKEEMARLERYRGEYKVALGPIGIELDFQLDGGNDDGIQQD